MPPPWSGTTSSALCPPRPLLVLALLIAFVILGAPAGAQTTNWTAFNDHLAGSGTSRNATDYNIFYPSTLTNSGFLKNIANGAYVNAKLTIINNYATGSGSMSAPGYGTPASNCFGGYIDFGSGGSNHAIQVKTTQTVTYRLTGLDTNKVYGFKGTACRGGNYLARWSKATLNGAKSFLNAHLPAWGHPSYGVLTSAQVPADLATNAVAWDSGENRAAGALVDWEEIVPANDGSFEVVVTQYGGTVPGGPAMDVSSYAYAFSAISVSEITMGPPVITSQPQDVTINVGSPVTLTVTVAGSQPFYYQWRKNGVPLAGATNQTFSLATSITNDSGLYAVYVTNSYGSALSSNATVSVMPAGVPIAFVNPDQPSNTVASAGHPVTLSVAVTGSLPYTFQWYKNDMVIPGATNASYTIAYATEQYADYYYVEANNPVNHITSRTATLTVGYDPVVITTQPVDFVGIAVGGSASFTAGVGGSLPRYNWYKDGSLMANATNLTLTITNAQRSDIGRYYVVVTNPVSRATSAMAILYVTPPPYTLLPFTNVWEYEQSGRDLGTAWRETNYNDSAWPSGPGVLGYDTKTIPVPIVTPLLNPTNGFITTYFRTQFVFTNDPAEVTLWLTNEIDDGAVFYFNGRERMRIRMPTATTYGTFATPAVGTVSLESTNLSASILEPGTNYLAVEVHQNSSASSDIDFGTRIMAYYVQPSLLSILDQPTNQVVEEGRSVTFVVQTLGSGARFQWYKDGVVIPGATGKEYTIPYLHDTDAGIYSVLVSNILTAVRSSNAALTVLIDTNPPSVVASDSLNPNTVVLSFNEALLESTATNVANYIITNTLGGTLPVWDAVLTNGTNVILTTASRAESNNYLVVISQLRDASPRTNLVAANTLAAIPTPWIEVIPLSRSLWNYYDPVPGFDPLPDLDWMRSDYEVAAHGWAFGPAGFCFARTNTPLPCEWNTDLWAGVISAYFRNRFLVENGTINQWRLRHVIDDGAAFYLNGAEFLRTNLPPGSLSNTTLATKENWIPALSDYLQVSPIWIQPGANVLAVELHGADVMDAHRVFAAELTRRILSWPVGPMMITTQPADVTVVEGSPAAFRFVAVGNAVAQWRLNGMDVSGATNETYTIPAVTPAMDGLRYGVRLANNDSSVLSREAVLHVAADTNPPVLLSAIATASNQIQLAFSEPVSASTATNPAYYAIVNTLGSNVVMGRAVLDRGGSNVILTVDNLVPGYNTILWINHLCDSSVAGNRIAANSRVLLGLNQVVAPMDSNTIWKYDNSGVDQGIVWLANRFDDSSWSNGAPVFYACRDTPPAQVAGQPVRTILNLSNATQTADLPADYFRFHFYCPLGSSNATLTFYHIIDDGAVFYFNGREIYRTNITNNPVIYDHLADDNVGTAPYFGPVTILVTNMFPGDNVLAVEVHQATLTSSDLAFAASFRLTMPSVVLPPCEPPQVAPETQVLSIRPYGALISIAWPTPGPILQQTTNLARPVVWEDVPGHPASPVLFTPDAPRSFYRLLQPP